MPTAKAACTVFSAVEPKPFQDAVEIPEPTVEKTFARRAAAVAVEEDLLSLPKVIMEALARLFL
jgi:hypothetical protein